MKKFSGRELKFAAVLLVGSIVTAPQAILAQDHVVAPSQIQKDVSHASAVRQRNEKQLKGFLAMEPIQQAMKSRGIDPQQVTNAVSQLSDAELAKLAAQTKKAQRDYAAGFSGLGIFTLIGIIVVAIILISVFA